MVVTRIPTDSESPKINPEVFEQRPNMVLQISGLQTEQRNSSSANIDRVSADELCRILNRQDAQIPKAVEACIPVIAEVVDVLTERVRNGGRVFYIGAGTSGR